MRSFGSERYRRGPPWHGRPCGPLAPDGRPCSMDPWTSPRRFRDRAEAGRVLADAGRASASGPADASGRVVLGLPRGGVPVAAAVADRLGGDLDVLTVRKIGAPGHGSWPSAPSPRAAWSCSTTTSSPSCGSRRATSSERTEVARRRAGRAGGRFRPRRPRPGRRRSRRRRRRRRPGDGRHDARRRAARCARPGRPGWSSPCRSARPTRASSCAALADVVVCPLQPADVQRRRAVVRRLLGDDRRRRAAPAAARPLSPRPSPAGAATRGAERRTRRARRRAIGERRAAAPSATGERRRRAGRRQRCR